MKLVLVEWEDAFSGAMVWTDRSNLEDAHLVKCITCGFLISETDEDITVCLSRNELAYSQAVTIPKNNIGRIRTLKVGRI